MPGPVLPSEHQPGPAVASEPSYLQRQVAESFGTEAERYDRARPSYPAALVDRIVAASPGPGVLDAGCGTGIASRLFQAAGCQVLGIDPDPRMAGVARAGGLQVEVAKLEDWDPGGRLAVFWNAFGLPPALREAFGEVYRRAVPGSPLGGFFARPAVDAYLSMCATVTRGNFTLDTVLPGLGLGDLCGQCAFPGGWSRSSRRRR